MKQMSFKLSETSFGWKEGVPGTDVREGCAEVGLAFAKLKCFQACGYVSFVILSSGVLVQELVAFAWLRFPMSSLRCDLTRMVPQDLVERGVRHLLYGFGREVVRGKNVPMLSDELGDKLLRVDLEVVVGEEGNPEWQVVLGQSGVAECKHSSESGSGLRPPRLLHVVGQAVEEGDRLVVVLATAQLTGGIVFLLGVAGNGVAQFWSRMLTSCRCCP